MERVGWIVPVRPEKLAEYLLIAYLETEYLVPPLRRIEEVFHLD
jgi:hypothetical protein